MTRCDGRSAGVIVDDSVAVDGRSSPVNHRATTLRWIQGVRTAQNAQLGPIRHRKRQLSESKNESAPKDQIESE